MPLFVTLPVTIVVLRMPLFDVTVPAMPNGPVTVSVPVAVRFAVVRSPEKSPLPWTERLVEGVVVPMPSQPLEVKVEVAVAPNHAPLNTESSVVEALPLNERRVEVAFEGNG